MPLRDHLLRAAQADRALPTGGEESHRPGAATGDVPVLEVEFLQWGDDSSCQVLATLGSVELEYAALQRGVGVVDAANRGTITLAGNDAVDLIDRIVTAKVQGLGNGQVVDAFLTDRTGRIVSDLRVIGGDGTVTLDLDWNDVSQVAAIIESMLFAEDVRVAAEPSVYRLELHGSQVGAMLTGLCVAMPELGEVVNGEIGGVSVRIARRDLLLVPGVSVVVSRDAVVQVWEAICSYGQTCDWPVRPVGWYAFNMARLEARTPMWHVDFGPANLPHETGLLGERVSFTKGCYPGQEVVARMENLGHPKQVLRFAAMGRESLPIAGGHVLLPGASVTDAPIGGVTSSAPSPMRGTEAICVAMIKWAHASPGTLLDFQSGTERWSAPVELVGALERGTC